MQHLTKLRCTPRLLWTPAQVRQIKTPYGTDDQVGFLAGQSKQTCIRLQRVINTTHQLLKAITIRCMAASATLCTLQPLSTNIPFSLGFWLSSRSIELISGLSKPSLVQGTHLCMHNQKKNQWTRASVQAH